MGLLAMIPEIVERVLLHVLSSIKWVCQIFLGLLAMIPKLVERVLLHVFSSIKWVCQIVHGSAGHDPQVSRESSAACILIY